MNAEQWNDKYPVGTPVIAYPCVRPEHPLAVAVREQQESGGYVDPGDADLCKRLVTVTRTPAWTLGDGEAVVSVEGYAGGICLTHIDVADDRLTQDHKRLAAYYEALLEAWQAYQEQQPVGPDLEHVLADAAKAVADKEQRQLTEQLEQARRIAFRAACIPAWEAVYEPGNVSDYLIGFTNGEAAAKGAAIAWLQSESDMDPANLEWVKEPPGSRHDRWYELIENHEDGIHTGVGIIVRRTVAGGDLT
ncbi:hypothetical protein [Streptomyces sp. Ac-502]|uniref:hypothetical protein n=1 Tax=Streptomyces sp. Ac-502 TaxID=3342801 RepID=UPI003862965E